MATVNLGRIKPIFKGAYSGSTAYVVDDIVTHGNETFICIQAHGAGAQATTQTAYWTKLAAKGTDGTDVGTTITTQGDILYRDGSGLQRLAKPASNKFLQNTSGGVPSWEALSSNFEFLSKGTFSSVASVEINGLSTYFGSTPTDYKWHKLQIDMVLASNANLYFRQMTSGSADSSSLYSSLSNRNNSSNAGPHVIVQNVDDSMKVTGDQLRGASAKHSLIFDLTNMTETSSNNSYLQITGSTAHVNHDGEISLHGTRFAGCTSSNNALNTNRTGLNFFINTSTMTGTWRIWGIKE
jgi:hypothetical protein